MIPTTVPESILIVGLGSAGYRHLFNAKTLGVRDIRVFRTGAGVHERELPDGVHTELDLADGLNSGVTVAVVANPSSMHVTAAFQAARAGCHVLVEKPLSHSIDGIACLQQETRSRGLVAQVGYQFRFHPALRLIRSWLQEEIIGSVVSAHVRWGEYLPAWQPGRDYRTSYAARAELGGGVLLTLSHPIDYLRWLLGEVRRVSAFTSRRGGLEINVEDTALLHLEFESGVVASVSLDYVQQPPQHNLTIVGRKGSVRWDYEQGSLSLDAPGATPPCACIESFSQFERNQMFLAEMAHFFSCIEDGKEPSCSLNDGERVVRICLAAMRSACEGRRFDV